MAERREEKYLISYTEYAVVANRIRSVLTPDSHGINGRYAVCSVYFDDAFDTALLEKEDGLRTHIKYRIRTYDGKTDTVRLERKTKRGIVTEKDSALLTASDLKSLLSGTPLPESRACFGLSSEMRSRGLSPKICVRYDREAYYSETTGVRVTFDLNIDSLPPDAECLFGRTERAIPATSRGDVIMEIKYGERCPSFIRKCCCVGGMQQSVSKYALCRMASRA